jgi:hypothetical protein
MSARARAWSGVGSEGITKPPTTPSPAGPTRLRVRVA